MLHALILACLVGGDVDNGPPPAVDNGPAKVLPKAPKAPAATKAFVGHTHTCANGHTWDHSMDGGSHVCPTCGLKQTVVDVPGCANGACLPATTYAQPVQRGGFFQRRR